MPSRPESVDNFDDFFGLTTPKAEKKPVRAASPVESEKAHQTIATLIKSQPTTIRRTKTPSENSISSLGETQRTKTPPEKSISQTQKKTKTEISASIRSQLDEFGSGKGSRAASVQSKVYESDFDDENDGSSSSSSEKISNVISRRQRSSEAKRENRGSVGRRRGSESDLKTSSFVTRRNRSTNEPSTRGRPPVFPSIRGGRKPQNSLPAKKKHFFSSPQIEDENRISSARNNKLRDLESKIELLRRKLEEQKIENSTLKTIQRREEKAIKKYEQKEYDVHRIVRDFNNEIEHVKRTLSAERQTNQRLEKQIQLREEKAREQTQRLQHYEKIVQEKNLEERFELQQKINKIDKKLEEYQEKLSAQERYIENLEKNHRHEVKQEMARQRQLKRELQARVEKYNELLEKFEDKSRQVDTMHIYAQRVKKTNDDSPRTLVKARSLQSLNETSPRPKAKQTEKTSTKPNGFIPASKSKEKTRPLSPAESVEEEIDDKSSKAKPNPSIERDEKYLSQAQIHKRPIKNDEKPSNGTSIFKLTEPVGLSSKKANEREKKDLDDKWSNMFGSTPEEDSSKVDLLSKLIADEQQERRIAAGNSNQRSSMKTFETSNRTSTIKPAADPFDSLFGPSKNDRPPAATRNQDQDDIFSTKTSAQPKTSTKSETFDSLFGNSNSTSSDRLNRPKIVNNLSKPIPNRTIFDEVDEFVD